MAPHHALARVSTDGYHGHVRHGRMWCFFHGASTDVVIPDKVSNFTALNRGGSMLPDTFGSYHPTRVRAGPRDRLDYKYFQTLVLGS